MVKTAPAPARLEAHDVTDDLGHGLVVLGRDLLVEIDAGVQGARQRRVLDDRDAVPFGHLADARGHRVDALGDADGGVHAGLVSERHRRMVGLVKTIEAVGTCAIMRLRERSWRSFRIRPVTCGSPSLCLCSSRTSWRDMRW